MAWQDESTLKQQAWFLLCLAFLSFGLIPDSCGG